MTRWIVGVDAGGTRTRAAAMNPETGECRIAVREGANWTVHGPSLCRERIEGAVGEVLEDAAPSALCAAVAGYYPPDHETDTDGWLQAAWPGVPARMAPDVHAAWAGALAGDPGIVLISGTGSICYGRSAQGEDARAGGWGPLFSDQGSAYRVGVDCLRALADMEDGLGPATVLANRVLARWPQLGRDVTHWLRGVYRHQWGREQVAALAAEVMAAADSGDSLAMGLVNRTAAELLAMAGAVQRRLGDHEFPLALEGGLGTSHVLRRAVGELARLSGSRLRLVESRFTPLEGAVLLAAESLEGADSVRRVRGWLAARTKPGTGNGGSGG